MPGLRIAAVSSALTALVVAAAVAYAGGGPPAPAISPPELSTVVGHGAGTIDVAKPRAETDASIQAVVTKARRAALPEAVASARADAIRLARVGGLTLGQTIGLTRDVPPDGYSVDASEGTWGRGQWCRVWRGRRHCEIPETVTLRVTLTISAS